MIITVCTKLTQLLPYHTGSAANVILIKDLINNIRQIVSRRKLTCIRLTREEIIIFKSAFSLPRVVSLETSTSAKAQCAWSAGAAVPAPRSSPRSRGLPETSGFLGWGCWRKTAAVGFNMWRWKSLQLRNFRSCCWTKPISLAVGFVGYILLGFSISPGNGKLCFGGKKHMLEPPPPRQDSPARYSCLPGTLAGAGSLGRPQGSCEG